MKRSTQALVAGLVLGAVLSLGGSAFAQTPLGTAFTYQGRLNDGGSPANGVYDLQFILFDALLGGSPVGPTLAQDDVAVTEGLFTVALDFGALFPGEQRFLEVGVRPGGSSGAYTILTPRQELTPGPNALFSATAPWTGITGKPPGFADDVDDDVLGALLCVNGEVAKFDGTDWVCGVDADTTYTAGPGLTLSGTVFGVAAGGVTTVMLADDGVTTAKVADGTLLGSDVASGQVVRSLNAQADGVTLAGTNGLSVTAAAGAVTVTSNATPASTAGAIVSRDASGNFAAGTVTLGGNLALPDTSSDTVGVVTKAGLRFLHNFGAENTFLGSVAGNTSLTGFANTAVGAGALSADTTGSGNSALGRFALQANTTGSSNSAFGLDALASNTGNQNSAFGSSALGSNTTGLANSAFGSTALSQNPTGSFNSGFGFAALSNLAGGDTNIALGERAGFNLQTGSNNIYIGNFGAATESNTIRIGTSQTAAFMTGISGQTSASGVGVFVNSLGKLGTTTSSRRYKEGIVDMRAESDVLMRLRPVAFHYRPEYGETGIRQYGLVAEEVAEVAPELVVFDAEGQPETVRYHFVNAMLLNQVQKQQSRIQDLEARLQTLEAFLHVEPLP